MNWHLVHQDRVVLLKLSNSFNPIALTTNRLFCKSFHHRSQSILLVAALAVSLPLHCAWFSSSPPVCLQQSPIQSDLFEVFSTPNVHGPQMDSNPRTFACYDGVSGVSTDRKRSLVCQSIQHRLTVHEEHSFAVSLFPHKNQIYSKL